jgi:hypothetical protein
LAATSPGGDVGARGRGAKLSPNGYAIERRRGQARSWAGAGPFPDGLRPPRRRLRPAGLDRGVEFQPQIDPRPRPVFAFSLRNLGRCCAPRDSRFVLSGDPSSVVVANSTATAARVRMSGLTDRCRLPGGRADRREPVTTATAGLAAPLLPDTPRGRATAAFGVNHCTEFARGQAGQGSAPRLLRTAWLVRLRRRPQRPEQLAHCRQRRPSGYLVPAPGGIVSVCTARHLRGHPDCRAAPRRVAMRVA